MTQFSVHTPFPPPHSCFKNRVWDFSGKIPGAFKGIQFNSQFTVQVVVRFKIRFIQTQYLVLEITNYGGNITN